MGFVKTEVPMTVSRPYTFQKRDMYYILRNCRALTGLKTWLGQVLSTLTGLKTWLGPVLMSSYGLAALIYIGSTKAD